MSFAVSSAMAQEEYELTEEGFEQQAAPDPNTDQGQLHQIRKMMLEGEPGQAARDVEAWIDRNPMSPLIPEAYLLHGDALVARQSYYEALFKYEHILRMYPGSRAFEVALERELKIAETFAAGVERKLLGMRIIPAEGEAEELFIRIQERAPGSKVAERAGIALGDFYYDRGEMEMAAEAYDLFLENYPHSPWRQHALMRQVQSDLATFRGPSFDATGLLTAQQRLIELQDRYPAAAEQIDAQAMLSAVYDELATKSLQSAQWYEDQGKLVSAAFLYRRILQQYPATRAAQYALQRLEMLQPQVQSAQPTTVRAPESPDAPAPNSADASETSDDPTQQATDDNVMEADNE